MGYEIERKFLVKGDYKSQASDCFSIRQGYLSLSGKSVIRIRTKGESAFITIKSALGESKIKRHEWEYEIPLKDAGEMLTLCENGIIEKNRYLVDYGGHLFEVDEFFGDNEGLVIAEIELQDEDERYDRPDWLGNEVSADERYFNLYLSKHPYKKWNGE